MNDDFLDDTISRNAWVDAICDRFEGEWRAGLARPIPEFLRAEGIDPESAHPDLLEELAKLEEAYRPTSQDSDPAKTLTEVGAADADTHSFRDVDSDAHGLATGKLLPKIPGYRVIREIARGGMGIVYLAHEPSFQREVAVKVLTDRYRGDPRAARRFVAEARLTGRLQHPGIPPVFEVGKLADNSPFLAMKLIEGKTFKEVLAEGRLAPGSLLVTFEHICQAVAFAHNRGIIHRDLKPANVMVGAFGEVQVMDWGLAKVLDRLQADAVDSETSEPLGPNLDPTRVGAVVGTPQYMAPEQARGEAVDRRADVFGLGAILCEALTGQPPFVGRSPREIVDHAATATFGPALRLLDSCSADADIVALCRRCLAPLPQGRPADAGALAKAVAGLRAAADARLKKAELDRAAAETKVVEAIRRRKVLFALIVVLLVGIGATTGFAFFADFESRRASRAHQKNSEAFEELRKEQKRTDDAFALVSVATRDAVTQESIAKRETEGALEKSQNEKRKQYEAFKYTTKHLHSLNFEIEILCTVLEPDTALRILQVTSSKSVLAARMTKLPEQIQPNDFLPRDFLKSNRLDSVATLEFLANGPKDGHDLESWVQIARQLDWVHMRRGAYENAITLFDQILIVQKESPTDTPTLVAMHDLGNAYLVANRIDLAIPILAESHTAGERHLPIWHELRSAAPRALAQAYAADKQYDKAVPFFELSLERLKIERGIDSPDTIEVLLDLELVCELTERWNKLQALAVEHLEYYESHLPKKHGLVLAQYSLIGRCQLQLKQYEAAEKILRESLEVWEKWKPDLFPTFHTRVLLGEALLGQKKYSDAQPLLETGYQGLKKREKTIPQEGRRALLEGALDVLIRLAEAQEKPDDAKKWKAEKADFPGLPKPSVKE